MNTRTKLALAAALGVAVACGSSGIDAGTGVTEPLVAHNATFVSGQLPGDPPAEDGTPDDQLKDPRVTSIESANNIVRQGEVGKKLTGQATLGARSVAVKFADQGSGYWAFPVDVKDPQAKDRVLWEVTCDIGRSALPGLHAIRFVALDENGVAGTQRDLKVCVPSLVEGIHACDPTKPLPAARIVLSWDSPVDLDLRVTTPSGKLVTPKDPTTAAAVDGGVAPNPSVDGQIDRDSNRACAQDGIQTEVLTFPAYPEKGVYHLGTNLFDTCGQHAVRFTLAVYVRSGEGKEASMVERFHGQGVLTELDVSAEGPGLFVSDFIF